MLQTEAKVGLQAAMAKGGSWTLGGEAKAAAVGGRLGTGADEAVFWSGIGPAGEVKAAAWAGTHNGATLKATMAARGIQLPKFDGKNPAAVAIWRLASREFAASAQGDVRVLQGNAVGLRSTWAEAEWPALKANSNVKSVTAINPESGEATRLWPK